jgi:Flp pilus assembly protein TadD
LNRALEVCPKGFDYIFANLALSYFMLGDNPAAAAWAQKSIDANTGFSDPCALLAIAYSEQGDEGRARAAAMQARQRFPDLKAPTISPRECVSEAW